MDCQNPMRTVWISENDVMMVAVTVCGECRGCQVVTVFITRQEARPGPSMALRTHQNDSRALNTLVVNLGVSLTDRGPNRGHSQTAVQTGERS